MKLCIGLVFQSLFVTIVATTHTSFLRFCISNAPNPLQTRYDTFLGEDKFVTDRTRKLTSKQFVFTRCHRKVDLTLNIQRSSGDVTWLLIEL